MGNIAIFTQYRGPTDYRGSRITATAPGRRAKVLAHRAPRITIDYDDGLSPLANHRNAANELAYGRVQEGLHASLLLEWLCVAETGEGYVFIYRVVSHPL